MISLAVVCTGRKIIKSIVDPDPSTLHWFPHVAGGSNGTHRPATYRRPSLGNVIAFCNSENILRYVRILETSPLGCTCSVKAKHSVEIQEPGGKSLFGELSDFFSKPSVWHHLELKASRRRRVGNVTSFWVTAPRSICSPELRVHHTAGHSVGCELERASDLLGCWPVV